MRKVAIILLGLLFALSTKAAPQKIDANASSLKWLGKKVTGEREGTIKIKSGFVDFETQKGEVVVDMTSIVCTNLSGKWKTKMEEHFKNDHFFSTNEYEEAKLNFKKIKKLKGDNYVVTADLQIKNVTRPISFKAQAKNKKFMGNLKFDRTEYGIKFRSGKYFKDLGDKMIYDEVTLTFEIALN